MARNDRPSARPGRGLANDGEVREAVGPGRALAFGGTHEPPLFEIAQVIVAQCRVAREHLARAQIVGLGHLPHDSALRITILAAMLLAGDVGGTKTLLGLFSRAPHRPAPVDVQSFPTLEYDGIVPMIRAFLRAQPKGEPPIEAACFGVAGPVLHDTAWMTNVPWKVDGRAVALEFGLSTRAVAERSRVDCALGRRAPAGRAARPAGRRAEPRWQRGAARGGNGHGPVVPLQRRASAGARAVGRRPRRFRRAQSPANGSSWTG